MLHTLNIANLPPAPWIEVPAPLQARMCFANKTVVLWDEEAGIHAEIEFPLKRGELFEATRQLIVIGTQLRMDGKPIVIDGTFERVETQETA